jgi:hypothetical protein
VRQAFSVFGAILMLVVATVFQAGFLDRYLILGAQVNLPIVVALSLALVSRPAAGGALGLLSGILTGAISGASMTHYAVSRVLAGYFVGTRSESEPSVWGGAGWVALGSLIAQLVLIILAPPSPLGPAIGATILTAVYNGVVALPVFALVVRLFQPKVV